MPDDIERCVIESRQVLHIPLDKPDCYVLLPGKRSHRLQLPPGDVEKRRGGAELGEEDRIPPATGGEREDP